MFKYKIKIILKSGYEIRLRTKNIDYGFDSDGNFNYLYFTDLDYNRIFIIPREIAAIIVKRWYQRWE